MDFSDKVCHTVVNAECKVHLYQQSDIQFLRLFKSKRFQTWPRYTYLGQVGDHPAPRVTKEMVTHVNRGLCLRPHEAPPQGTSGSSLGALQSRFLRDLMKPFSKWRCKAPLSNLSPPFMGWGEGAKFTEKCFARNCMKCHDLYTDFMFSNP